MSFAITLSSCSDDPRKLTKTLSGQIKVNSVKPTGIVDLMNPSFELDYDSSYTTKNYCEVGAPFNRSYFITDMKIDIGKKIIISCAVDVLETYKEGIKPINANVIRSEKTDMAEPYLPDNEYKIRTGFQNYTDVFAGGASLFNQGDYVLSWMGGYHADETYIPVVEEPGDWASNWRNYYVMEGLGNFVPLSEIYPSASSTPSFEAVKTYFNGVYTKIS